MNGERGIVIVFSGPSGCGKGTVLKYVLDDARFAYSVSATTRSPRPGEIEGKSYYFVDKNSFEKMIENGEMLEHAEYVGNYYGTPAAPVEKNLENGINVILEIEVQGAMQIKNKLPDAVLVLLIPPDYRTLRERLSNRGTEEPAVLEKRMKAAEFELSFFDEYDYVVINRDGEPEKAAETIKAIAEAERAKRSRSEYIKENFFN